MNSKKIVFITLLSLLGATAFSTSSHLEMNEILKGYGLLIVLQGGFLILYWSRRRWRF